MTETLSICYYENAKYYSLFSINSLLATNSLYENAHLTKASESYRCVSAEALGKHNVRNKLLVYVGILFDTLGHVMLGRC